LTSSDEAEDERDYDLYSDDDHQDYDDEDESDN